VRDAHLLLLDDGERGRRARLRHAADRDRFTVGSATLRLVLGHLSGVAAHRVQVDRSCPDCDQPHGKPVPSNAGDLECSVSHSGDRVVVAVTHRTRIGVDVERIESHVDHRLIDRVLAPCEAAVLRGLPAALRARGFSTYWTRKEAILKATGSGLRVAPDQVRVSPPGAQPRLLEIADPSPAVGPVTLFQLSPGDGYTATLAALDSQLATVTELDAALVLAAPARSAIR